MDYVILDAASGAADNNGGRDHSLPLVGAPNEAQVARARAAALAAAEQELLAVRGSHPWFHGGGFLTC